MSGDDLVRVRSPRNLLVVPLAAISLVCGVAGAASSSARSGAVERSFPASAAITWYAIMMVGAVLVLAAMTSPAPTTGTGLSRLVSAVRAPWLETVCPAVVPRVVTRMLAEQIGLSLVGWLWTSYGIAALAIQGWGGSTAASLAMVVSLGSAWRMRQLHVDTRDLRAWRDRHAARGG